ncbi:GDP-L-fucose synthase family protein [Dechloromonas sp. ARDL1]|uniref:GDP-L-fucose synthase family protein n=1 Tax=Dechloromonas sp. ARDL1 TaxID=3322121 RepID=UPI003DA78856
MDKNARIFVAGHRGMVGSAIVRKLQAKGYTHIVTRTHQELDLINQAAVDLFFEQEKPDYVFLAAAKVGGIQANNIYRADFIYQNLMIEANIIHAAHKADVNRMLFLGSSCIYPRDCPQPITEEYLLTGPLEQTNEPYAIAKIAGIKLCESYNRQYGRQYVSVMPTNLYGPNDSYDLANSHVLPALIRKVHLAKLGKAGDIDGIRRDEKIYGYVPDDVLARLGCERDDAGRIIKSPAYLPKDTLLVWGSGTPRREFLYVDDLADACLHLMEQAYDGPLMNVGTGTDVTIRELAETVMRTVGFGGEMVFDTAKPDGTPRKMLDVSRIAATGWTAKQKLATGIKLAYEDYFARLNQAKY